MSQANAAMSVLLDGTVDEPRLDHPEGVAVDPRDGSIWCGGERGQIYRIAPDGSTREVVASTEGFCLGMAFGPDGHLFVCDLKHSAVLRLDPVTCELDRFADGVPGHRLRIPNWPAFDAVGRLYISDSYDADEAGPGILRFDIDGSGEMWHPGPFRFANGMAFDAECRRLYVAETHANRIVAVPVETDGSAGRAETVAELPGILPDGVAVGSDGSVIVACYEPSRILRIDTTGEISVLADDPTAHVLCHPTNVAFTEGGLISTNLGRWHLTKIAVDIAGVALPPVHRDAGGESR